MFGLIFNLPAYVFLNIPYVVYHGVPSYFVIVYVMYCRYGHILSSIVLYYTYVRMYVCVYALAVSSVCMSRVCFIVLWTVLFLKPYFCVKIILVTVCYVCAYVRIGTTILISVCVRTYVCAIVWLTAFIPVPCTCTYCNTYVIPTVYVCVQCKLQSIPLPW